MHEAAQHAPPEAPAPGARARVAGVLGRAAALVDEGRWNLALLLALAGALWLPTLGRGGLWDPWETHYAEVAREMLARGDLVHPYWESAYFFSKPVLSFWLIAAAQALLGVHEPIAGVHAWGAFAARLPAALSAIAGVAAVYALGARLAGRRAAFFAALVLATSPQYLFLGRQAVMDMPLVALFAFTTLAFAVYLFAPGGAAVDLLSGGERESPAPRPSRRRLVLLYGAYVAMGAGVLNKGLLGIALPGAVLLAFLLLTNAWRCVWRLRPISGTLVVLAVAAPWITYMSFFPGIDDEGRTFFERFFTHDHLNRLAVGVHSTTPGGSFAYYVEQLGFAMFPWSALVPVALAWAVAGLDAGTRRRPLTRRRVALTFGLALGLVPYLVFSLAVTKFHHYIFPALPGLALVTGAWMAALAEPRTRRFAGPAAFFVALVVYVVVARDLSIQPKRLLDLFVYNYERPYPKPEDPVLLLTIVTSAAGTLMAALWLFGPRRFAPIAPALLAVGLAFFHVHVHLARMGPHWSQEQLFVSWYAQRRDDEPIAAYQMNWRGETFYSFNTVEQFKTVEPLREFVRRPGREWVLTEQGRYRAMVDALGPPYRDRARIVDRSNLKYYLVAID